MEGALTTVFTATYVFPQYLQETTSVIKWIKYWAKPSLFIINMYKLAASLHGKGGQVGRRGRRLKPGIGHTKLGNAISHCGAWKDQASRSLRSKLATVMIS